MPKYAVGVYSTRPAAWKGCDSEPLQARIDALPAPVVLQEADGEATIETYTIAYVKGQPAYALVVGRLVAGYDRFLALSQDGDAETLDAVLKEDPLGRRINGRSFGVDNRFTCTVQRVNELDGAEVAAALALVRAQLDLDDGLAERRVMRGCCAACWCCADALQVQHVLPALLPVVQVRAECWRDRLLAGQPGLLVRNVCGGDVACARHGRACGTC